MPKALLSYELPEETQDFTDALNGRKYAAAIEAFQNQTIRSIRKHNDYNLLNEYTQNPQNFVHPKLQQLIDQLTNQKPEDLSNTELNLVEDMIHLMANFLIDTLNTELKDQGVVDNV